MTSLATTLGTDRTVTLRARLAVVVSDVAWSSAALAASRREASGSSIVATTPTLLGVRYTPTLLSATPAVAAIAVTNLCRASRSKSSTEPAAEKRTISW